MDKSFPKEKTYIAEDKLAIRNSNFLIKALKKARYIIRNITK